MNDGKLNSLNKMTDNEILLLIGNTKDFEKGFRELMSKYQEKVYWHIRRMVNNHEDANDIIQNTFIKVYRNIQKFKGNSRLYTWIYRIATNETMTFLKKQNNYIVSSIDNHPAQLNSEGTHVDSLSGAQIRIVLDKAIDTLPEKQKQVFNLRYFEEMSYAEMSDLLGTSVGALKASYHHAVKKIEVHLRTQGTLI